MSLIDLNPSRSTNSSDSGRPLREARLVSRRSTCDRNRELYSCVRSSVTDSASARCTRSAFSIAIAPGSIAASSASRLEGVNRGAAADGALSSPTKAPMIRPRHASGKATTLAAVTSGTRRSASRLAERNTSPLRITKAPTLWAAGSSAGVSAREASARVRLPPSMASTSQEVAGTQSEARDTRASATRSGSRLAFTARIMSASTSARPSVRFSPAWRGRSLFARSRRAPDTALLLGWRRARGCRPVPINRLCVLLEWRIPLSPSILRKYNTLRGIRPAVYHFMA